MARQITDLERLLGNQISEQDMMLIRDFSDNQDKRMTVADLRTALSIAGALSSPSVNGKFIISKTDHGVTFEPYAEPEFTLHSSIKLAGKQYVKIPFGEFLGVYDRVKVSMSFRRAASSDGVKFLGLGNLKPPAGGIKLVYRTFLEFKSPSNGVSIGDVDNFPIPVVPWGNLIEMTFGTSTPDYNIPCQGYSANGSEGRHWQIGLRYAGISDPDKSLYFGGNALHAHPGSPALNFSNDAVMNIYVGRKL